MSDFKFTVSEAEYQALMRKMEQLADVDKKPVLRKAYKSGGKILITAGKSSFLEKNKKKTGNLYRSFTSKMKKKNSGILIGFRRGIGLGNHAHLIDRGTTHRFTQNPYVDKLGRHYPAGLYRGKIDAAGIGSRGRGKTGKTFFWSNVVQMKGEDAMKRIVDAVYDAIEEIKNRN